MNLVNKFRIQTYNVGFVLKDISRCISEGLNANDIIWLKHKYKDRFFADPFLFAEDTNFYYILCEEFLFWEEKGKITCLKVSKKTFELISRNVVIEEKYHLSFPFCNPNSEWVVPEACKSGKTIAYRIDKTTHMIKEKKTIVDHGLIDNVYFRDKDGQVWLYAGHTKIPSTELFEYKLENNGVFRLTHKNPIASDNRTTRGAGRFFSCNGKLYRPVQDCQGRYGRQTKIMAIESIGCRGYSAKEVCTLNSFKNPPFNETMHTFNVYDKVIIVDGSRDYIRFPEKILFKKCKWLFNWRRNSRN